MITEHLLLDDGAVAISEVGCDGSASAPDVEEVARRVLVTIPLGGVYVRVVRRAGRGTTQAEVGDPGSAILFRPGEPYRVSHPVPGRDRSFVIALRRDGEAIATGGPCSARSVPLAVTIGARRLIADLRRDRVDSLTAAERVAVLLDLIDWGLGRGYPGSSARDRRLATAVQLEIAARLAAHLTLPQLGASLGLSGWELARRFRRATGTSIHAYRTRLRVNAALERVDAGERDLTALALDLGFSDHSHLTNVVRRHTGLPPSAFRSSLTPTSETRTILQA